MFIFFFSKENILQHKFSLDSDRATTSLGIHVENGILILLSSTSLSMHVFLIRLDRDDDRLSSSELSSRSYRMRNASPFKSMRRRYTLVDRAGKLRTLQRHTDSIARWSPRRKYKLHERSRYIMIYEVG